MTRKRVARSLKERQVSRKVIRSACSLPFSNFHQKDTKASKNNGDKTETNVAKFFSKFFQLQLYKRRDEAIIFFTYFTIFRITIDSGPSENIVYTRESWSPREDKFRETTGNDKREKFTRVWVIEDLARVAKIFFIPRLYDLYAAIQHRRHLLLGMLALTGVADENISLVEI